MFQVWTRITAARKSHRKLKTAVGGALDPFAYAVTKNDQQRGVSSCHNIMREFDYTKQKVGVGLSSASVEEILAKASAVKNGVVVVTNAAAFNENTSRKTGELAVEEEDNIVTVWPLAFWLRAARTELDDNNSWWEQDFRFKLLYGRVVQYIFSKNDQDIIHKFEAKRNTAEGKKLGNAVSFRYEGTELAVVYNGEVVNQRSNCLQCPRKLNYGLGMCAFAKYNCILGTDLDTEMLEAPNPEYKKFFGTAESKPSECIKRDDFDAYLAYDISPKNVDHFNHKSQNQRHQEQDRALKIRRQRQSMCTNCAYGDSDRNDFWACYKKPISCKGPHTKQEVAARAEALELEPWFVHVLMWMNGNKDGIHYLNLLKWFPTMKKLKTGLIVSGPIRSFTKSDLVIYTPRGKRGAAVPPPERFFTSSPGARTHEDGGAFKKGKYVVLRKPSYPFSPIVLSYEEFCEITEIKPVKTMKELEKLYTCVARFSPKVISGIHNFQCRTADKEVHTTCDLDENTFTVHLRKGRSGYTRVMSSNRARCNDLNTQSKPRAEFGNLLNEMAGDAVIKKNEVAVSLRILDEKGPIEAMKTLEEYDK